ncbi:MAG: cysteine--tRNA ligase [Desulfobulbaceae bacterium]|nr:cysteine--tRNA ligase [Desulfobulbaceae bacterium]HIJ78826.1 cysteine--tRNA ligase [Deltaproteobacteria bacterium]
MTISIYNTLSGTKAPLETIEQGHVKLYVCGITAYDYCHIGHARSALVFDMIVRYLRHRDFKVTYIRNFTDIDDKIIKRAQEQNTTCDELSSRFIRMFHEDMENLGVLPPTLEPKATEHVQEIIDMIQELIAKDLAYQVGNDVYYKVTKFAGYGSLSGRNLEDMQAGARISVNEEKQHPMDFALWKGSKPGEPTWESPWGPGRPGWHIECSAMSRKYHGKSFDIHGGGKDLIFPHHENELAQSEGANGEGFVKYWVHHGFVNIKDEKMSKSLGNFLTIREVLADYPAEALRLFIFSTHYRNPLDYSSTALNDAVTGLNRIYSCLAEIGQLPTTGNDKAKGAASKKDMQKITSLAERFHQAMDNDFNTAQALGHIFEVVKALNKIRQHLPAEPATADLTLLHQGAATVQELGQVLGLLNDDPAAHMEKEQDQILSTMTITPDEIQALIDQRNQARQDKNWARADEIRDQLLEQGIELKDDAAGTSWQVKSN